MTRQNVNLSRVESKLVLYGLLAGIMSGLLQSVTTVAIMNSLSKILSVQAGSNGNVLPEPLRSLTKVVWGISPILAVFQCALYGAIFGVVAEVLVKAGLKVPIAAFVSGLLYFTAFGITSLATLLVINMASDSLTLCVLSLAPPITYLVLLTLFSTFRGPWSKVFEKGPKYY